MNKKFIAGAAAVLLIIPSVLQAAVSTPEDFMPGNALVTADFQLSAGRIKNLIMAFLEENAKSEMKDLDEAADAGDPDAVRAKVLKDKVLAGERFFVSFSLPEAVYITFKVNDDEWKKLTVESEKHEYGSTEVFSWAEAYVARIGEFLVFSNSQETLHQAVDLAEGKSTDSLSNNAAYKNVTKSYFSPRLFGFTLNIKSIAEVLVPLLGASAGGEGEQIMKAVMEFISLFEWEGMSLAEVSDGYKFNFKIVGNAEKLREHGLNFNPGGNFTPNLYKKFPKAKPILYSESFNLKAGNEQEKKFIEMIKKALDLPEDANIDIWEEVKKETGFDINEIYNTFDRGFAIGVQHDENSPLPAITIMGDVSNNKTKGEKFASDLANTLKKFLKEEDVPKEFYKIKKEDGLTKFIFNVMKIHDYDGPPFPKIVVTFGVNEEGMLIVSNYAGDSWTGFELAETGPNTGIFYLNMRNLWGWFDAMAEWGERAGGGEHGPPLDFYQGYYSVLENIYGWRDLLVVSTATESESVLTGTVNIDQAKHKTYEQLLEEIKSSDRDGDGINDYEERYVYHTSVESSDSDNDGVDDFEELQKGFDPEGEGRLWEDVSEDAYYTDEVSLLYQRGAIKGYDDGTFKPGQLVNRAEFTTMIVSAFEQGTSNFLGVDVELKVKAPPFVDLDPVAWYYPFVAKAYAAGFISGSPDPVTGELKFRPGDNITRAEAVAILNKASDALSKTKPQVSCADSPFDDVPDDAWFCDEVTNAYMNGVTKGKAERRFGPNDYLIRADAAVMIRRTLEKDIAYFEEGTKSVGELAQPLVPEAVPGLGGGGGFGSILPF